MLWKFNSDHDKVWTSAGKSQQRDSDLFARLLSSQWPELLRMPGCEIAYPPILDYRNLCQNLSRRNNFLDKKVKAYYILG
jgi:hypothetical protein